jgi:hypothetical protein
LPKLTDTAGILALIIHGDKLKNTSKGDDMTNKEVQKKTSSDAARALEKVVIGGDLADLGSDDRVRYYKNVCDSQGLNYLTQPFSYIEFPGIGNQPAKLTLYANKSCTEQLAKIHGISTEHRSTDRETFGKTIIYIEKYRASMVDSRGQTIFADATGTVPILETASPKNIANAILTAETKARRRAVLSLTGLAYLDETEVVTVEGTKFVDVDPNTGEIGESRPAGPTQPAIEEAVVNKDEYYCELHDVNFVKNTNQDSGQTFYSHAAKDSPKGWCNEFLYESKFHEAMNEEGITREQAEALLGCTVNEYNERHDHGNNFGPVRRHVAVKYREQLPSDNDLIWSDGNLS